MLRYTLKRLLQMIPTVIGVMLITFILFFIVPNDLAAIALGKQANAKRLQEFDTKRGLDKPLFFGRRATSRAYRDTNLAKNAGRWNSWTNTSHSVESGSVSVDPNTVVNPLAYELNSGVEYEWAIRFRGAGELAGEPLTSAKWKTKKVRFDGGHGGVLRAGSEGLEIKELRLRRMQANPFDSQLWHFTKQIARGDLGYSESFQQPVSRLLMAGIPVSLSLQIPIFVVGVVVSIALSLICAFFRNTWVDRFFVIFSVALMSINYIVYIVAGQYILAYKLGWFPIWGYESWRYFILPAIIGVISGLGANIRFYRTVMLDEMYKEYVRTAFAKGVSKPRVLFVHVLKNAMIPIITNVVIAIPFLYTGSLLLESFFGIPGLGYLGINAIMQSDVDVVRALVLITALLFVVSNLLTDICYALADPRVKLK